MVDWMYVAIPMVSTPVGISYVTSIPKKREQSPVVIPKRVRRAL